MPLRVMQIYLPPGSDEKVDAIIEDREVLGRWEDAQHGHSIMHLIVPAEETEPIMDRLEQAFSGVAGFHVVLSPVEAVLPRLEPKVETEMPGEEGGDAAPKPASRISREELLADINETIGVNRVFLALTVLSGVVAAIALLRDDIAVLIGAMVIAPLLGPNIALSLATTLGDTELLKRALYTNFAGVFTAFVFAVIVGAVFKVDPGIAAIADRTEVGVGDILLALAAGSAGTLAFTRGLSGAVIGVMVAVALLPPVVACGLLLGAGYWPMAFGALLLTGANVICVNLAGIVTFLAQGVRPMNWREKERAKSATRTAILLWITSLIMLSIILWLNAKET